MGACHKKCRYNLLQREAEAELLPFCQKKGNSFIPWGPLAYGLLGGKYSSDFKLAENDWRHRSEAFDPGVFEKNLGIVEKLKAIAEKKKAPVAHLAVQWLLSKPAVGSVIAGAKRVDQVEQNARADGLMLTPDEAAKIDALGS